MKTIIAVSFLGIVMNAVAQESKGQGCNRPAMAGFDFAKYLKMPPAYQTHTEKAPSPPVVCRITETKQTSDGKVDSITYDFYKFGPGTSIYYSEEHCNIDVKSMKGGQFSADCSVTNDTYLDDQELLKDEVDKVYMSVLDTDYQNYAILYRCYDDGEHGIFDDILVLKTNRKAKSGLVKRALQKVGKDLKSFTRRNKNAYCDKILDKKRKM
uniref:Putative triabin n=1 Tax=Panstrongylus lignarius TaxID=156445 RepID=A0A224XWJ0_9HEMI